MMGGAATVSSNGACVTERERLESKYKDRLREETRLGRLVSYVGNKSVPLLRLYRYKEAFAHSFVEAFIDRFKLNADDYVLDPFAGMGTTVFTSWLRGIPAVGIDRLPIAVFVAKTLFKFTAIEEGAVRAIYQQLRARVSTTAPAAIALDVPIIHLAFQEETLLRLRRWKAAIDSLEEPARDLLLLLFFAILEPCSFTSKDGQFLRLCREKRPADPDTALLQKCLQAEEDIFSLRHGLFSNGRRREDVPAQILLADSRKSDGIILSELATAVITSPPYVNRYDYTRTYALELCFHFIRNFEELRSLRHAVLRSHIESRLSLEDAPTHPAVAEVVDALRPHKLNNPRIPHMLIAYFVDMHKAMNLWAKWLKHGACVAMVVDNVRFQGEHIPVDLILSEMAESLGFVVEEVIVSRYKGNSSQQMGRYGRIPVRESVVIWRKL